MERNYVTVNLFIYTGNQFADVTKRVDSALRAMLRYGPFTPSWRVALRSMFLIACLLLLVAVFSLASATMHHRDFTPRLILSKKIPTDCSASQKCADITGTVLVPWAAHFQC